MPLSAAPTPLRRLRLAAPLLFLLVLGLPALPARAEEAPVSDAVRKAQIRKLGIRLRKKASSPRAPKYKPEILSLIESLEVLGGWEAGEAALKGVSFVDEEVRNTIFALVDKEHDPKLVKPLGDLLEDKDFRRDDDLRRRIARSLSIMADGDAVPHLTELIRGDEAAETVAAAADALATYGSAPLRLRKEAVKRLVDLYTTTYNLMLSIKPEHKVIASVMKKRWKVYARSVRAALQALTGQHLTRPQEWRAWWNENKKKPRW